MRSRQIFHWGPNLLTWNSMAKLPLTLMMQDQGLIAKGRILDPMERCYLESPWGQLYLVLRHPPQARENWKSSLAFSIVAQQIA